MRMIRNRTVPVLLSFVLLLSLIPAAYAKPMTVVLEAVGDTNKEFVYFIRVGTVYVDRTLKNVEVIKDATFYWCGCGFNAISYRSEEGVLEDTGWREHWGRLDTGCGSYSYISRDYYKVTLKSGEKIAINTFSADALIYAVQQDGYQISYTTDGTNYTSVSFDSKVMEPEKTLARISFSSVQDGILTIRQSNSNVNGTTFTDVPSWCANAVNWAVDQKVAEGVGNKKFEPDSPCTHAMILTFLWRAAGAGEHYYGISYPPPSVIAKSPGYAEQPVRWAYYEEEMIAENINPNASCTRTDAVKYIWQVFGKESASANSFNDVDSGVDYAAAVAWAVEKGITNGYANSDGSFSFRPDKVCSRGEIITLLHRAYVEEARLK